MKPIECAKLLPAEFKSPNGASIRIAAAMVNAQTGDLTIRLVINEQSLGVVSFSARDLEPFESAEALTAILGQQIDRELAE